MGRPIFISLLGAAAATSVLVIAATPAGKSTPTIIRNVHINGTHGPAYYSVVDGGFRPIVGIAMMAEQKPDTAKVSAMADASR